MTYEDTYRQHLEGVAPAENARMRHVAGPVSRVGQIRHRADSNGAKVEAELRRHEHGLFVADLARNCGIAPESCSAPVARMRAAGKVVSEWRGIYRFHRWVASNQD